MTTEIEKQFFDTFRIEPKCETRDEYHKHECYGMVDCEECASAIYPQITDRILLELYCALCNAFNLLNINRHPAFVFNIKDFKKFVLKDLIDVWNFYKNKHIKQQVQALFKEWK